MTVSITFPSPPNVNANPSLTVRGTDIGPANPAVTGTLTDMSEGGSWGGSGNGSPWSITFNPDAGAIENKDYLIVSVHDTGTGEGCQQSYIQSSYSEQGGQHHHQKGAAPKDPLPDCGVRVNLAAGSDPIDPNGGPQDFKVTVTLPGDGRQGYVYLCLLHKNEVGTPNTFQAQFLSASKDVPFQVNFKVWDGVCVVATIDRCKPAVLRLKPPGKAPDKKV